MSSSIHRQFLRLKSLTDIQESKHNDKKEEGTISISTEPKSVSEDAPNSQDEDDKLFKSQESYRKPIPKQTKDLKSHGSYIYDTLPKKYQHCQKITPTRQPGKNISNIIYDESINPKSNSCNKFKSSKTTRRINLSAEFNHSSKVRKHTDYRTQGYLKESTKVAVTVGNEQLRYSCDEDSLSHHSFENENRLKRCHHSKHSVTHIPTHSQSFDTATRSLSTEQETKSKNRRHQPIMSEQRKNDEIMDITEGIQTISQLQEFIYENKAYGRFKEKGTLNNWDKLVENTPRTKTGHRNVSTDITLLSGTKTKHENSLTEITLQTGVPTRFKKIPMETDFCSGTPSERGNTSNANILRREKIGFQYNSTDNTVRTGIKADHVYSSTDNAPSTRTPSGNGNNLLKISPPRPRSKEHDETKSSTTEFEASMEYFNELKRSNARLSDVDKSYRSISRHKRRLTNPLNETKVFKHVNTLVKGSNVSANERSISDGKRKEVLHIDTDVQSTSLFKSESKQHKATAKVLPFCQPNREGSSKENKVPFQRSTNQNVQETEVSHQKVVYSVIARPTKDSARDEKQSVTNIMENTRESKGEDHLHIDNEYPLSNCDLVHQCDEQHDNENIQTTTNQSNCKHIQHPKHNVLPCSEFCNQDKSFDIENFTRNEQLLAHRRNLLKEAEGIRTTRAAQQKICLADPFWEGTTKRKYLPTSNGTCKTNGKSSIKKLEIHATSKCSIVPKKKEIKTIIQSNIVQKKKDAKRPEYSSSHKKRDTQPVHGFKTLPKKKHIKCTTNDISEKKNSKNKNERNHKQSQNKKQNFLAMKRMQCNDRHDQLPCKRFKNSTGNVSNFYRDEDSDVDNDLDMLEHITAGSLGVNMREHHILKSHVDMIVNEQPSIDGHLDILDHKKSEQVDGKFDRNSNFDNRDLHLTEVEHWSDGQKMFKMAATGGPMMASSTAMAYHPGGIWRTIIQEL